MPLTNNLTADNTMQFRKLGHTDIQVSQICLGTMTWGEQNTEAEAHQQLDTALEAGVNFIDTAEMYPVPPKEDTYALTERYIGTWLKQRQNRDKVILATKVAGRADWLPYLRDGKNCFDRKNIETALNYSLQRLQTDYIDLYQLHWPDRKTNFFGRLGYEIHPDDQSVPLEETLQVLADLVKSGKVRTIGVSNETPWGVMRYLQLAQSQDMPRIVSVQNPYNLLNRSYEIGLSEISHRETCGLLAYSPLAFGMLSGKYLDGARPEGARLTLFERFDRYSNPRALNATQAYVKLAREHGLDPAQMALAYVNSRPFLTSTIIGATDLTQLRSNLDSINISLSQEVLQGIEQIHTEIPNPSP
jgi:aryl-alcohol dehydrogenase-like predicted oxidoreductase